LGGNILGEDEMKDVRPGCRDRFQELERDMMGVPGDEYGMRRKVGIMWTDYLKRKESGNRKQVTWDKILQVALALLQSGLLIFVLTGGKMS